MLPAALRVLLCDTASCETQCPLWVKSRHSGRGTDVRCYPQSDRNSDVPNGRYVPIATGGRCSEGSQPREPIGQIAEAFAKVKGGLNRVGVVSADPLRRRAL
jgi:hypothetical protein